MLFFLRLILRFDRLRIGSDNQAKRGKERGSGEGGEEREEVSCEKRVSTAERRELPGDSILPGPEDT